MGKAGTGGAVAGANGVSPRTGEGTTYCRSMRVATRLGLRRWTRKAHMNPDGGALSIDDKLPLPDLPPYMCRPIWCYCLAGAKGYILWHCGTVQGQHSDGLNSKTSFMSERDNGESSGFANSNVETFLQRIGSCCHSSPPVPPPLHPLSLLPFLPSLPLSPPPSLPPSLSLYVIRHPTTNN